MRCSLCLKCVSPNSAHGCFFVILPASLNVTSWVSGLLSNYPQQDSWFVWGFLGLNLLWQFIFIFHFLCICEDIQVLFLSEWYQEKVRTFLLMERETKQKDPISSLSDLLFHPDAQPLSNMSPPPQHTSLHPSPVSIRSPSPALHLPTTQKVNPLLSLIFHRTVLNFNCGGGYTTLCLSKSICNV